MSDQEIKYLRSLISICIANARDFNRSVLELKGVAPTSTGWTRDAEIRAHRRLRVSSMQQARAYRSEVSKG
jgi:hypothetical protein